MNAKLCLFFEMRMFLISDDRVDHAAVAIGYGEDNGKEYWLIKNSWSTSWGKEGYMKIWTKDDNCGVTKKAVVVKIRE